MKRDFDLIRKTWIRRENAVSGLKGLQPAGLGEYRFCDAFYHRCGPEPEHGSILRAGQFAGNEKQLVAELLECAVLPGLIQTVSLKRSEQMVREADHLQIESVGCERCGGNLA